MARALPTNDIGRVGATSELLAERDRLRDDVAQLEERIARASAELVLAQVQARSPRLREIGWGLGLSVLTLLAGTVALFAWMMVVVSHID
jgi:hypothetical protein